MRNYNGDFDSELDSAQSFINTFGNQMPLENLVSPVKVIAEERKMQKRIIEGQQNTAELIQHQARVLSALLEHTEKRDKENESTNLHRHRQIMIVTGIALIISLIQLFVR